MFFLLLFSSVFFSVFFSRVARFVAYILRGLLSVIIIKELQLLATPLVI